MIKIFTLLHVHQYPGPIPLGSKLLGLLNNGKNFLLQTNLNKIKLLQKIEICNLASISLYSKTLNCNMKNVNYLVFLDQRLVRAVAWSHSGLRQDRRGDYYYFISYFIYSIFLCFEFSYQYLDKQRSLLCFTYILDSKTNLLILVNFIY